MSGVYTIEEMGQADSGETTTATSPARLMDPDLKHAADEQARLRLEAADIVPDWIAMLNGYTCARDVEGFLDLNGWEMQHMPANARGRLWTAIKRACEKHGVTLDDAKKIIRDAREAMNDESAEPPPDRSAGEVSEDELPPREPGDDG